MDEILRKALRNVDDADPATFLAAGRQLERAGASAELFSDLLERLLQRYSAVYQRDANDFDIAWNLKGQYRRCLRFTLLDGGILQVHYDSSIRPEINVELNKNSFSYLLDMIIKHHRLSHPTLQFLQTMQSAIASNGVVSCNPLSPVFDSYRVEYVFDVVAKINPKKDWQPDYHLRFKFVRSLCRDLLEVSIEDNLYWGTEHEVQGMRLTGTSFTLYGGEDPEDDIDDPHIADPPYTTYEMIPHIDEVPELINEIFSRFRQI